LRIFPADRANNVFDNAVEPYEFGENVVRPQSRGSRGSRVHGFQRRLNLNLTIKEFKMAWTKPEFTDLRFGFEVTMYIANR